MNELEARKICVVVASSFPNSKFPPDTEAIWIRMLQRMPYAAVNAAVEAHLLESKFPPVIADIAQRVHNLTSGHLRTGAEAWGDFKAAVHKFGFYRKPYFDDPSVAKVVDALGWQELCSSENEIADRARFIDAYDRIATRDRSETLSLAQPARQRLEASRLLRTGSIEMGKVIEMIQPKPEDDDAE